MISYSSLRQLAKLCKSKSSFTMFKEKIKFNEIINETNSIHIFLASVDDQQLLDNTKQHCFTYCIQVCEFSDQISVNDVREDLHAMDRKYITFTNNTRSF